MHDSVKSLLGVALQRWRNKASIGSIVRQQGQTWTVSVQEDRLLNVSTDIGWTVERASRYNSVAVLSLRGGNATMVAV